MEETFVNKLIQYVTQCQSSRNSLIHAITFGCMNRSLRAHWHDGIALLPATDI